MPTRRLFLASWATAVAALLAAGGGLALWQGLPRQSPAETGPMLLAPMIGVIEPCILAEGAAPGAWVPSCTGPRGSAAALVEATLRNLQPQPTADAPLGYTLPVPLLNLFRPADGGWVLDQQQIDRLAPTIADNARPLVLSLFSTHFSTGAPIEVELALDPDNLATTRDGPLPADRYQGAPLYHWGFARTDTPLTQRRVQAVQAMLDAVCRLEPAARARVRGITLLGELHHLFPNFEAGMGFGAPYRVSDYSAASQQGFRDFLRARYGSVAGWGATPSTSTRSAWLAADHRLAARTGLGRALVGRDERA